MFFSLLMCLAALGRLVISAGVSCSAAGGSGGNCEELRWCKNGVGSKCNISAGYNEATQADAVYFPESCYYSFNCLKYSSSSSAAASVPQNITVVASPAKLKYYVDLHIQWEDSIMDDPSIMGYEVLVFIGNEVDRSSCGCSRSVRSLPYTGTSRDRQTATVPFTAGPYNRTCIVSASNREHCISPNHIMPYTLLKPSDVTVTSSYTPNSSSLMQVQLTWEYCEGMGVVIALDNHTHSHNVKGSPGCTTPGRNPPCFLSTLTSGVMLKSLNTSYNYTVHLYQFNSSLCPGLNPSHLLDGCGSICCTRAITITPPHARPTTTMGIATSHDHHMTQPPLCATPTTTVDIAASTPTVHSATPTTTVDDAMLHDHTTQPANITPQNSTIKDISNKHLMITVPPLVVVTLIATLLLLVIVVKNRVHCAHAQPSKSRPPEERGGNDTKYCSTCQSRIRNFSALPKECLLTSSSTPSPLSTEALSLHQLTTLPSLLSHASSPSTPTISTTFPPCTSLPISPSDTTPPPSKSPINTTSASHPLSLSLESRPSSSSTPYNSPMATPSDQCHQMLDNSVLIIYSPSINDEDRKLILEHLVVGLMQYGVSTHCHDTACIKSPCQWIEQEIRRASAVLCVCNEDFHREWDESPASGRIPIVCLLKHLVHATVSRGESLAKYATILLESGHAHYIPSLYLQGDPRLFLVTEVEDIVRFVRNVPSYTTPSL